MKELLIFIGGMSLGGILGLIMGALMAAAKRADEQMEKPNPILSETHECRTYDSKGLEK